MLIVCAFYLKPSHGIAAHLPTVREATRQLTGHPAKVSYPENDHVWREGVFILSDVEFLDIGDAFAE